jgi:hypothetical protein
MDKDMVMTPEEVVDVDIIMFGDEGHNPKSNKKNYGV